MRLAAPAAKTERARRMVTIPEFVTFEFAEHLKRDVARGGCARGKTSSSLRRKAKRFADPHSAELVWRPAARAAGQEGFRFANLRHKGATLALEAGANPVLVAFRLGHTSTRMVEQHYAGEARPRRQGERRVRTRRLHLESVLGPDFVTCGDGRIRFLTCGFDASAVPIRFLTCPRQFAGRMRDETATQVSVSVRTRFDSRSWRRRERYENHNASGLGVWVYARCCDRIAEYKRGSSRRCRSLTPSAPTHWAR
jgi:hypothetical protein